MTITDEGGRLKLCLEAAKGFIPLGIRGLSCRPDNQVMEDIVQGLGSVIKE